jgi:hypothetical protein
LPNLAFLVGNYIDDLARGQLCESAFYRWLTEFFCPDRAHGFGICRSRRPFSLLIKNTVAPTALLYTYADTMNDFNFYTEREVIPVWSSR